jgi:NadR type nicotinamide-nucleotide adenylyltransferase
MDKTKKIVIIGPESTGKSTLSDQLAHHYDTSWVNECAREWLLKNGTEYNYDDLLSIAKCQLDGEDKVVNKLSPEKKFVFIDTDMYVMKVWCEYVFSRCHHWILNQIVERKYDLYLLCNTDVPWVKDELREYPDLDTRRKLFGFYKQAMIDQQVPWIEVSGDYDQRVSTSVAAIDKLFQ